jgi:hypothetical protein
MFINDIVYQLTSYRADDVQIYISCEPHRIENCICIRNMNMDLDRMHQWYIEKCLAINTVKSQVLLVNPYILLSPMVSPLLLGSNHNTFVDNVKNLGMIKLLSFVGVGVRLWTFSHLRPVETRRKLVISLIVLQFLYGDT